MGRVGITGAAGRMGRHLVEVVSRTEGLTLAAAIERPGAPDLGRDAGELAGAGTAGVIVTDDLAAIAGDIDVLVDFTIAEATVANIEVCAAAGTRMVIGTTGLDAGQKARLDDLARNMAVVMAPNYSIGVNVTFKLLEVAATIFGDSVDIEVLEAHHRHKVDAPSGTALGMGEVIAQALGRSVEADGVFERHGITGERDRRSIGFQTLRGGDIVGEHTVMFAGAGERVEITHRAHSRLNFAEGAVRAATWILERPAGRFDMQDVLGLRTDRGRTG